MAYYWSQYYLVSVLIYFRRKPRVTCNLKELANPGIRELQPYLPGKPIAELQRELGITDIIKLASNENPLGASPQAIQAAQQTLEQTALYPDSNGFELKQAIARYLAVKTDQITLGNGSDNVLS